MPPLAAGLALRGCNLRDQVLGGDELHGVRAAVESSPGEILRHFSTADHSLPLSALFSALLRRGVVLDEMAFRVPSLLAGALLLAVLPALLARTLGRPTAATWAWLLALSPSLVLYSRIARSYLPMVLATSLALAAFAWWWERRAPARAAAFVLPAALAVWLHLGAAPIVASPFLFALLDLAVTRPPGVRRALRDLALLGAALAACFAAFLVPALPSVVALLAQKRQEIHIRPGAVAALARMQAGTADTALTIAMCALAGVGAVVLARTRPRLAALGATAFAVQLAAILLLSPEGSGYPIVLNRYLLPALPFLLLAVACAVVPPAPWKRTGVAVRMAFGAAAALLLVALWWTGPLRAPAFLRGSFAHHNAFVAFAGPALLVPPEAPLAFYDRLPPGPIVEIPWPTAWNQGRSLSAYQLHHGRRVLVSATEGVPRVAGLRLRNEVAPSPATLLASPAAAVVVHRCLPCEEAKTVGGVPHRTRIREPDRGRMVRHARRVASSLRGAWGLPDVAAGTVVAWDLSRIRRGAKPPHDPIRRRPAPAAAPGPR